MTLASHVHDGALGAWFRARLADPAGTTRVLDDVTDALRGRRPLRSPRGTGPGHAALVQASVRSRLALVVQHAPPYRALVGAYRLGLASPARLHQLAARFPSHAGLDPGRRREALRWRPAPGGWLDAGTPFRAGPDGHPGREGDLVDDVVQRALVLLDRYAPPGRLGGRRAEEELAAACTVMAGWAAGIPAGAGLRGAGRPVGVLPAAGDGAQRGSTRGAADEVVDLVSLANETGVLHRWHQDAGAPPSGTPLGTADAVFLPGWAEGGTVVGCPHRGPGALLVDVLTTADPRRQIDRIVRRCHHLLARTFLDGPERHGVAEVGLYLARHGVLVTWPVEELLADLAAEDVDPNMLLSEFLAVATHAAAADGVRLRTGRGVLNPTQAPAGSRGDYAGAQGS